MNKGDDKMMIIIGGGEIGEVRRQKGKKKRILENRMKMKVRQTWA